jgi:competence protein ComGC
MSTETKRGPALRSEVAKKGFTIVELLTVMSIVIILMGILVPALSRVRRYAKVVTQKGQFHEISKGLELFRNDHQDNYPDSGATDPCGDGYCGAMKMCEALLGQDGMGFHTSSRFLAEPTASGTITPDIYPFDLCVQTDPAIYTGPAATNPELAVNLQDRIRYVDPENIKAYRLQDIYTWDITTGVPFYPPSVGTGAFKNTFPTYSNAVVGDVFLRATIQQGANRCQARAGQKTGMPVLYYKADPSKLAHDAVTVPVNTIPNSNIFNFDDNYAITRLGCPWEGTHTSEHPMSLDPVLPATPGIMLFYREIANTKITSTPKPHNEDGYILMSAGWDGLYGTKDDVFNFTE